MKAALYTEYGPPDVLQIRDVEKPAPNNNEVLVRVRAASVNPLDCGVLRGAARIVNGLLKPIDTRLGVDMSGQVEAVGSHVAEFKPGDEVFGACIRDPQDSGLKVWIPRGAFAEYACAPESILVLKPDNVTFEQAASVPVAAIHRIAGSSRQGTHSARPESPD